MEFERDSSNSKETVRIRKRTQGSALSRLSKTSFEGPFRRKAPIGNKVAKPRRTLPINSLRPSSGIIGSLERADPWVLFRIRSVSFELKLSLSNSNSSSSFGMTECFFCPIYWYGESVGVYECGHFLLKIICPKVYVASAVSRMLRVEGVQRESERSRVAWEAVGP